MSGGSPADAGVAGTFRKDTANHEMTVLHDEGLYRHLRFRAPAGPKPDRWTGAHWFDLVTWPGNLVITGDIETFSFSRLPDMFEFFRSDGGRINPGYWAEKVRAGNRVREYSEDRFRQLVAEHIENHAAEYPGLAAAVEAEIFGNPEISYEQGARVALGEFEHGTTCSGRCLSCDAAVNRLPERDVDSWALSHRAATGHRTKIHRLEGFRFHDTWEWDLQDFSHHFLWCCHAIVHGIRQYDQAAAVAA